MSQTAAEPPKLFGDWSFEGINVRDIGLVRYINLDPTYLPHSGGRHEARKFRKSDMNIVERLINSLMRPGSSGGEKYRITSVVRNAFNIINLKTGRNPVEVLVRAVENAAPNEDTTRIGYGGVVYRLAVDISPQRRIDLALQTSYTKHCLLVNPYARCRSPTSEWRRLFRGGSPKGSPAGR